MADEAVAWLLRQLDEDERIARRANRGPWWHSGDDSIGEGMISDAEDVAIASVTMYPRERANSPTEPGYLPAFPITRVDHNANADHIVRHDPAMVLLDIAAKRRMLAPHAGYHDCAMTGTDCSWTTGRDFRDIVLTALLSAYAERDGFKTEWLGDGDE